MKLSDFENYQIPSEATKRSVTIFKTTNRASVFAVALQMFIDVPIVLIVRSVVIALVFKYFLNTLPLEAMEELQTAYLYKDPMDALKLGISYNIHAYLMYSMVIAFVIGGFYYTAMLSLCKKGTIGMWLSRTIPQTKTGNKPSAMRATAWYYLKMVYPVCITIALMIFFLRGVNFALLFFVAFGVAFSSVFTTAFGVAPIYEKLSGIKIVKKS